MIEKQEKKARDIFKRYLKKKMMVLTIPRKIILKTIFLMEPHFTAEDLAERLKEGADRVSRGTVYRTLKILEAAGLARRMRVENSGIYYEMIIGSCQHGYLVCESCGKIIEFMDEDIKRLQKKVCRREGFSARRYSLRISGLCRECADKFFRPEKF
ncbi:MAG: transcriptional repressor [Candidatus Auribacterota bacterium]|nr:transcriptional repressor [Candidatus Auribacterota bacterium]